MQTVPLPTPAEADRILGFLIWRLSKLWQRRMTNCLKPLGIGSTQFVVLGNTVRLSTSGGMVSQRSISMATGIDVMTVSQTIRGLATKGLVQYALPHDRRERSVVPTDDGILLLRESLKRVSDAHERFFRLEQHNEDQLLALLQHLIKENSDANDIS